MRNRQSQPRKYSKFNKLKLACILQSQFRTIDNIHGETHVWDFCSSR